MKIIDFGHFTQLASGENALNCYILLNGGLRSGKNVWYDPENDSWSIFQEIDGATLEYASTEEFREGYPLLFQALETGCLFAYKEEICGDKAKNQESDGRVSV